MGHIDADTLALIALGDAHPDAGQAEHLESCVLCSGELADLTRTVGAGRASAGEELVAPPAGVWAGIQAELGDELTAGPRPDAPLTGIAGLADIGAAAGPDIGPAGPSAPHRRRRARRWRLPVLVAAAALAVGVVAGAGGGIWWQSVRQADAGVAVADAELAPFPAWPDARGSAVVEERPDGTRQVVVDVDPATTDGPSENGLREVWLIRGDGTALVSIGYLTGDEGRFDVPPGLDLDQYSLVDISAEQDDGDPSHSGDSIVRGRLRPL